MRRAPSQVPKTMPFRSNLPSAALDLDAAALMRLLAARYRKGQHTIANLGLDPIAIRILRQAELTAERALPTLGQQQMLVPAILLIPRALLASLLPGLILISLPLRPQRQGVTR